ncbi:hypothetical protein [Algicella marina]|uniref:Uncharacterized protein n=1 Tax=Algicella marina TaxID=2683284 RepID=A0A6P1T1T7_9RHOB|nr:hypothetical protein [Algicella marina]QHQ34492.1 hypothetical protein GO499_04460 [Algicella marina]
MIIPHSDQNSARHHADSFFGGSSFEAADVPWVKVGGLYMSVCITGENSWGPIAKDLSGDSRKVWVFTGRHGEASGNPVGKDGTFMAKKVYDIEHLREDRKIVDGLQGAGFNVALLDLYEANDSRTTEKLKALIKEKLDGGDIVVLAWCFSLFAMNEYDKNLKNKGVVHTAIANMNYDASITSIITNKFAWVPKPW